MTEISTLRLFAIVYKNTPSKAGMWLNSANVIGSGGEAGAEGHFVFDTPEDAERVMFSAHPEARAAWTIVEVGPTAILADRVRELEAERDALRMALSERGYGS